MEKTNKKTRTPPYSEDAETAVLGGILIDPEVVDSALEKITPDDFYNPSHKAIFQTITELTENNEPIDVISVAERLKSKGLFEQCGGYDYLGKLSTNVPSSANVPFYSKIIKEFSLRRKMVHQASKIVEDAFNLNISTEEFLNNSEQKILSVSENTLHPSFFKVGDVVHTSIKQIEELYDRKSYITGTPSGFKKLDKLTAGFQSADLIIIAARPSMGKTALALTIGQYVSIHQNKPAAMFSLEMSKEQLVMRMLCAQAKVDSAKVRTGSLEEDDFPNLVRAASKIAEAPFFIDDTPAITISELRAKCRRLHRETPLSLILVDYLQLIRSPMYAKQSREQEISDISRSLKSLAKELNTPVVALSQLNRSVEGRSDKRPIMSDLRESGAIEQDADLIMFIYRDEVYNEESEHKGIAEIIIAKQRNGPIGTVRLAFVPNLTLFSNLYEEDTEINNNKIDTDNNNSNISENMFSEDSFIGNDEDEPEFF